MNDRAMNRMGPIVRAGVMATMGLGLLAGRVGAALPVTSGLQLWFTADAGVTTNGGGHVTNWANQAGAGAFGAYGAHTTPVLQGSAIGNKPALRFEGSAQDMLYLGGLPGDVNPPYTMFLVLGNYTNAWGAMAGSYINLRFYGNNFLNLWPGSIGATVATNQGGSVIGATVDVAGGGTNSLEVFQQGNLLLPTTLNVVDNQITLNGHSTLGGDIWDNYYTGYIAEFIVFNRALTDNEMQQMNSYLLQEFGIVPEPSTAALLAMGGLVAVWRRRKHDQQ